MNMTLKMLLEFQISIIFFTEAEDSKISKNGRALNLGGR